MNTATPAACANYRPTSTMRQHIHLAPRRMSWDFSGVPACPVEDDPNLAAFILAISYFVVAFEDFGIPVVRNHLAKLAGYPELAREAQAFITQEALHSQGHVLLNTVMNERHGIDTTVIEREFRRFIHDMSAGAQQDQLAAVAALEHVIFSIAEWYETTDELRRRVHPEVDRLVLWHCMEETEHTAVVYDVYEYIYGAQPDAYSRRMAALTRGTRCGVRALVRMWRALVPQMAQRMGCSAASVMPWVHLAAEGSRYLVDFLRFLSPGFTPWRDAATAGLLPSLRERMSPRRLRPDGLHAVRVASVREVSADARTYELVAPDAAQLPPWTPGAHIDVEIETGIVRHYSLCGDPADRGCYRIAVKREDRGRGGSLRMHQEIRSGDTLRISLPRNLFALQQQPAGTSTLLLAGGIGITPLLAMAYSLHAAGADFELHVCSRDRQFLPFADEMVRWPFSASVRTHLDTQAAGGRVDLGRLIPRWDAGKPRALYVCGPAPFIDAALGVAQQAGWPAEALHCERFAHDAAGSKPDDAPFTLHLRRSDITLNVPADRSILEVMEARGMKPASSCREGICGSCICTVVEGEVDHRDAVLTALEHRQTQRIAICVSRARGERLAIDL